MTKKTIATLDLTLPMEDACELAAFIGNTSETIEMNADNGPFQLGLVDDQGNPAILAEWITSTADDGSDDHDVRITFMRQRPALPLQSEPGTVRDLVSSLQWLLDDMDDANQTRGDDGRLFDSVECAAAALVSNGGWLSWFSDADAAAFRARQQANADSAAAEELRRDGV